MAYSIRNKVNLDNELKVSFECIARASEKIHKDRILYSFTDHGIPHSARMVDFINKLLISNKQTQLLKKYEAFILLSAIYLHDIGIQLNKRDILDSFSKKYKVPITSDVDIGAYIRENHHLLSDYWIEKNICDDPILEKAYYGDKQLGQVVAMVVRSHGIDFYNSPEYNENFFHKGETIRIKLLCVLLCLADVLDCDCRRIDYSKQTYTDLPQMSRIHWIKHYYVQSIEINQTLVNIYYRLPNVSTSELATYKFYFSWVTRKWMEIIKEDYISCLSNANISFSIKEHFKTDKLKDSLSCIDYDFIEEEVFEIIKKDNTIAKFDQVAIGILKYDGKVLMVKRKNPEESLVWQFPAGRLKAIDTIEQAVLREVREETGINCRVLKLLGKRLHPNTKVLCYYVALEYIDGILLNGDPYENVSVEWISIAKYETLITSDLYRKIVSFLEK